jgi:hypothetical protein
VAAEEKLGLLAGIAMAQAMFTYTFGIVADSQGSEGKGLGTGVGLIWQGKYLIATAKHVIEDTPAQRIYYFLPQDSLQIEESSASIDWTRGKWQVRHSLENPRILYSTTDDLAVIVPPEQLEDAGKRHFYRLDEHHAAPPLNTTVGYLGYPSARAQPFRENYAATPCHSFGEICTPNCNYDLSCEFAITYSPGPDLDPRGFSGSGAWYSRSEGVVWSPQIRLAGLVTNYYRKSQVLICCRIERLTSFLAENNGSLTL